MGAPRKKAKNKEPGFYFYTGDWKKDPALAQCSPATRAIWLEIFIAMLEAKRCAITGTTQTIARLARCSEGEMQTAIWELETYNVAEVFHSPSGPCPEFVRDLSAICPGSVRDLSGHFPSKIGNVVTFVSRRLKRAKHAANIANERKKSERERKRAGRVTPDVTQESRDEYPASSYSSSVSSSDLSSLSPLASEDVTRKTLNSIWEQEAKTIAAGDWQLLDDVREMCARSARLSGAADPVEHTRKLIQAFIAVVDDWRQGNRPAPMMRLEGFKRNFTAAEERLRGVKINPPRGGPSRPAEPVRAKLKTVDELAEEIRK